MMNRKYLIGLFSILFITTIFSQGNRVLWDFGVVINTYAQHSPTEKSIKSISSSKKEFSYKDKALIGSSFIPPTLITFDKKVNNIPILLEYLAEISLDNIQQVKLLANRLTMQINYQPIIDMISQIDLKQLDENDFLDFNYLLADALFQTGEYKAAENVILTNVPLTIDDRSHFLLAMTYESQGRINDARNEYLKFITQFPKSDYKVTALIKTRMLGRR